MVTMMGAITMITDDHRDSDDNADGDQDVYENTRTVITTVRNGISDEYDDDTDVDDKSEFDDKDVHKRYTTRQQYGRHIPTS